MRGEPVFLGVYVKTSETDSGSSAVHARRWHAWGLADGSFLVQEVSQDDGKGGKPGAPEADVQRLGVDEFFTGFRVFAAFSAKHKPSFPRARVEAQGQPEQSGFPAQEADLPAHAEARAQTENFSSPENPAEAFSEAPPEPDETFSSDAGLSAETEFTPGDSHHDAYSSPTLDDSAEPAASLGRAQTSVAPAGSGGKSRAPADSEQDLVSFLTRGVGEDRGKDYVIVKGERKKTSSSYQAQAVIQYEDEPAESSEAVTMNQEEAARIEQSFRTDFSLSLIKLKSKRDDALKSLEKLAKSRGPFAREHKFMFTDCGLALRKRNLFVLAQQFHERAMVLSPDDEHVLFNLARVMYECGKTDKAREYLVKSVGMAPDFQAGRDFLSFLDGDMPLRR